MKTLTSTIEQETTRINLQNLVFGVHVLKGDHLPLPNTDSLKRINNESNLNTYKDLVGNAVVVINRGNVWSRIFVVGAFNKSRKEAVQRKGEVLTNWKTAI